MAPFLNFVPAPVVAPGGPTDPSFANVVLLLSGDGTNGGNSFPDDSLSNHTPAVLNTVTTVTGNKMFGTASINLPGAPGLTWNDHADWCLAPTDSDTYTVEMFFYPDTLVASLDYIFGQFAGVAGQYGWLLYVTTGPELTWFTSHDGTNFTQIATTSSGIATGAWHFIAISKNASGKIRIHVGPVSGGTAPMRGSQTLATNSRTHNSTAELSLGSGSGGSAANSADGQVDELRITKGVCRYDTDAAITIPTAAFPRS